MGIEPMQLTGPGAVTIFEFWFGNACAGWLFSVSRSPIIDHSLVYVLPLCGSSCGSSFHFCPIPHCFPPQLPFRDQRPIRMTLQVPRANSWIVRRYLFLTASKGRQKFALFVAFLQPALNLVFCFSVMKAHVGRAAEFLVSC